LGRFKYKIHMYMRSVIARRLCDEAISELFRVKYKDCFVVPKAALLAMTNRCSIVAVRKYPPLPAYLDGIVFKRCG
jgi:hypothetical protein